MNNHDYNVKVNNQQLYFLPHSKPCTATFKKDLFKFKYVEEQKNYV